MKLYHLELVHKQEPKLVQQKLLYIHNHQQQMQLNDYYTFMVLQVLSLLVSMWYL